MKKRNFLSLLLAFVMLGATACWGGGSSTGGSSQGSTGSSVGSSDTGSSDAGSSDTGTSDTGSSDTGSSDTGSSDTGSSDTGSSDTGSSSGGAQTPDTPVGEAVQVGDYSFVSGSFVNEGTTKVKTSYAGSMAVHASKTLENGTFEVDMTLSGTAGDNGIVFGLTPGTSATYWENNGTSYYFFFIDLNGNARLAKVNANGSAVWTNLTETAKGLSSTGTYRLGVSRDENSIECYIDGNLVLSYTDSTPLSGTKIGLRASKAGVAYGNMYVKSSASVSQPTAVYTALSGKLVDSGTGVKAKDASLAIHNTKTMENGTFSVYMSPSNTATNGVIFNADAQAKSYYSLMITGARYVEFSKTVNGAKTLIQKGVLSAAYRNGGNYKLTVMKNGGEIRCYFNLFDAQSICYAAYTDATPLTGNKIGVMTGGAGTIYSDITVSADANFRTADTLLFGHSYMEMWYNYKTDFTEAEYASIDDIGIGGSVAAHWELMIDQVVSYQPKVGIFDIGINDLTGGTSPTAVVESSEKILLGIKEKLPNFKVALISASHCPARGASSQYNCIQTVSETNVLFRQLAATYDWIYYVEAEYMFCDDKTNGATSNASWFIDGLHPSAAGYDLMAAAIKSALKGENQPVFDQELANQQTAAAKAAKLQSLSIYSEHAYTADKWSQAKPYYDAAVHKINACVTKEQVAKVDLSSELTALNGIENKGASVSQGIANGAKVGNGSLTKKDADTNTGSGYLYALDKTAKYADSEMVFRLENNTGEVPTGGILLRANQNTNNTIEAYLINFVTGANYMQVYRLTSAYNGADKSNSYTYIGGIVYTGEVENTDWYVKISGSKLYLCTLEQYQSRGLDLAIQVDLTNGGAFTLLESGYNGQLAWAGPAVSFDLTIKNFVGAAV